jgi:hypothetical protein
VTELRLNYKMMVTRALLDVVRQALEVVAETGGAESRPLYVSFLTAGEGVEIPIELAARYPEEMTIVFQHQFWNLEVERDRFSVEMAFQGTRHRLRVPFTAVTGFSDPSVPFGLRFDLLMVEEEENEARESDGAPEGEAGEDEAPLDNVIRFDPSRGEPH